MTADDALPKHAGDTLGSLGPWRQAALKKLLIGLEDHDLTAEAVRAVERWCLRRVPEATWQWIVPLLDDIAGMGPAVPGRARVIVDGKRWLPVPENRDGVQEDGEEMILLPVWEYPDPAEVPDWDVDNRAAVCAELLALRPRTMDWYSRTDLVDVLGGATAEGALVDDKPLRVYRYPAGWLKAGGKRSGGICVLDWTGWLPSRVLSLAPSLIGDDADHSAELYKLTRRPRHLPQIRVAVETA